MHQLTMVHICALLVIYYNMYDKFTWESDVTIQDVLNIPQHDLSPLVRFMGNPNIHVVYMENHWNQDKIVVLTFALCGLYTYISKEVIIVTKMTKILW